MCSLWNNFVTFREIVSALQFIEFLANIETIHPYGWMKWVNSLKNCPNSFSRNNRKAEKLFQESSGQCEKYEDKFQPRILSWPGPIVSPIFSRIVARIDWAQTVNNQILPDNLKKIAYDAAANSTCKIDEMKNRKEEFVLFT